MSEDIETEFNCDYNECPRCPYCGCQKHGETEDITYAPDEEWENTCYDCDKTYLVNTNVQYTFDTKKAPCKNGIPHGIKFIRKIWEGTLLYRCEWCEYEEHRREDDEN
jgi:hypothetical protein